MTALMNTVSLILTTALYGRDPSHLQFIGDRAEVERLVELPTHCGARTLMLAKHKAWSPALWYMDRESTHKDSGSTPKSAPSHLQAESDHPQSQQAC